MMPLQLITGLWLAISILCIHISEGSRCALLNRFGCANGNCIDRSFVCDGIDHCQDQSGEIFCVYRQCNTIELNIPNAEFDHCLTNYTLRQGRTIFVQCFDKYRLVGPRAITCTQGGLWSELPRCVQNCKAPDFPNATPISANISDSKSYSEGHQLLLMCKEGHVTISDQSRSHQYITCVSEGKWYPEHSGCIPKEARKLTTIQVDHNASVTLTCESHDSEPNRHYIWLKNSEVLNSTEVSSIDSAGTLTMKNVNANTIGHYTCFTSHQNGHISPSNTAYELKIVPKHCPPPTEADAKTYKVGLSEILQCPHSAADYGFQWFKDGQKLEKNNKKIMLPDGSLYILALDDSDQGQYTCSMINKDTGCSKNHSIAVQKIETAIRECGEATEDQPHPWMASLWQKDEIAPFCYGTLIKENWVITSAYCLKNYYRKQNPNFVVQLNDGENTIMVPVKSVKMHPQYLSTTFANDVGLIQLSKRLEFSDKVKPICLTDKTLTVHKKCMPEDQITVVGWGALEQWDTEHNPGNKGLREEFMKIKRNCIYVPLSVACATPEKPSIVNMAGDSGSPYEIKHNRKVHLLGIYVYSKRQTSHGYYDVFANITSHIEWINDTIRNGNKMI